MRHFSKVHIANTLFEEELAGKLPGGGPPFEMGPSIALQLQFLPTLYAKEGEAVLVLGTPSSEFKSKASLVSPCDEFEADELDVWGQSSSVLRFGQQYTQTPLEIVKKVNSRTYLFKDEKLVYPIVAKKELGFSGRGMQIIETASELPSDITGLYLESWKDRISDFSSQWIADDEGVKFLGWTELFNTKRGGYLGTRTSKEFSQNLVEPEKLALRLFEEGYRGPFGIDAFWYIEEGKKLCRHIVEVNARRTVSRAILDFSEEAYVQFVDAKDAKNPLLPKALNLPSGKTITFRKQLDLML